MTVPTLRHGLPTLAIPARMLRSLIIGIAAVAVMVPAAFAQWPTTCVELSDIVEQQLGNDDRVGFYEQRYGTRAETVCRREHGEAVRQAFGWPTATPTPTPTATPTPTPTPEPTPQIERSNWSFRRGTFGHGGTYISAVVTSSYFYSDDRYAEGPARLYVRCNNGGESTDVFINFGDNMYLAGLYDTMRVVHHFDDETEQTSWWTESVNNEAAFAPNAIEVTFALDAIAASRLSITIRSYDGEKTTARWTLRGHNNPRHPALQVLKECGRI